MTRATFPAGTPLWGCETRGPDLQGDRMKKAQLGALALAGFLLFAATALNAKTEMKQETMTEPEKKTYEKPDEETIREMLSPLEYHVTQESGTEQPYTHEYYLKDEPGIYVDIVTGEPLFSSKDKYHSSCGWPSFSDSLFEDNIKEIKDTSFGMIRTEVRSLLGDTHLGHVFENDPESPNGTRYCINGASLRFIPKDRMEAEGYGYLLSELD